MEGQVTPKELEGPEMVGKVVPSYGKAGCNGSFD